jgi:predicted glutamine amidotransferase
MCRWLAYSGAPMLLEDLLFKPKNSLIDQSMSSKSAETPTNGDGFGVGWFDTRPTPGLFRSIRPAWNDFNLRDLAAHVESPLFLAHVRATSQATVQETNCHPFRHKRWLFVHNGEIFGIEKFRKQLVTAIADDLFPDVLGTTDSEVMFYLALTFGLEADPPGALARMAGFVERVAKAHGVDEALWMTLGVSDGTALHAVRYASDGAAPTLFHSCDVGDVLRWNPQLEGKFSADTRLIVSEPAGEAINAWVSVPQGSYVRVQGSVIEVRPFAPTPPSAEPCPT